MAACVGAPPPRPDLCARGRAAWLGGHSAFSEFAGCVASLGPFSFYTSGHPPSPVYHTIGASEEDFLEMKNLFFMYGNFD